MALAGSKRKIEIVDLTGDEEGAFENPASNRNA